MAKKTLKNFELSLEKLEKIVQRLESGEVTLDESLKDFEEGVTLFKDCREVLESAQKKVKVLTDQLSEENLEV